MADQQESGKTDDEKGAPSGAGKNYKVSSDKDSKITLRITGLDPKDTVLMELETACEEENIPAPDGKPREEKDATVQTPSYKKYECCKDCVSLFKEVGDYVLGVQEKSFNSGKECAPKCNCHEDEPEERASPIVKIGAIVAAILVLLAIWWLVSNYGADEVVSPTENTQEETIEFPTGSSEGETIELSDADSDQDDEVDEDQDDQYQQMAYEPPTFGNYVAAEPELALEMYKCMTLDSANFRKIFGDKLDGIDKFEFVSAIAATLVSSPDAKYWHYLDNKGSKVFGVNLRSGDTCAVARYIAYGGGNRMLYDTPNKRHLESYNWVANSWVESVPGLNSTDFTNAVAQTLHNLVEIREAKKLAPNEGFYGVKRVPSKLPEIIAVNYAPSKASGSTTRTTRRKSAPPSPPPLALAHKGKYISPLRPKDIKRYVRGVLPATSKDDAHHGHDLAANGGTPIRSTSDGRVIKRSYQVDSDGKGYGRYLAIYDGKYVWRYAHMESRNVKQGDTVKRGQKIGTVGDTGAKGSFHLHIECWTVSEWNKKEAGKKATPISEQLWQ